MTRKTFLGTLLAALAAPFAFVRRAPAEQARTRWLDVFCEVGDWECDQSKQVHLEAVRKRIGNLLSWRDPNPRHVHEYCVQTHAHVIGNPYDWDADGYTREIVYPFTAGCGERICVGHAIVTERWETNNPLAMGQMKVYYSTMRRLTA